MAIPQEDYHKVFITKTISVHPSNTHSQQPILLPLSNLDRKCPALMYLLLFYTRRPPLPPHRHQLSEDQSLFTALRLGLEETLSTWYPAAGRLSLNQANGKLDLVCSNSGALLAEAVTQVHISELGDLSQHNDFFDNLVFRPPFSSDNIFDTPLVVAQVTKFGCGGYAVGVGTNHSLFDGLGSFNFLSAWASKAARREEGLVEPVHERGRLSVIGDQRGQVSTSVPAFEHLHMLVKQSAASLGGFKQSEEGCCTEKENFVLRTFSLSSAMVEKLKSKVSSSGMSSSPCSSFEVLAAHLWKV